MIPITDSERYLNLATFRRSGAQVNTPVWFAMQDDSYYLFSARNAGKVKRIRNSPKARIAPCDMRGNLTGEWLNASCRIADGKEVQMAYALLLKKYGWQMRVTNFFSRLTGKIHNRIVLVVSLTDEESR
jgi:PPOX class probable F420-dependent enzyme